MSTARWVVVGAGGWVGVRLLTALDGQQPVRPWTRDDADLTDRDLVPATLAKIQAESADPIICVNAAAVADVDGAERDPATADLVNAQAPGWLAEGLGPRDLLVQLSTDYVFGANAAGVSLPYDKSAPTAALSVYGRTKRDGEKAAVTDQVSRPTATVDLIGGLLALVERRPDAGIYHFTNSGPASRYDVAVAVASELGRIRRWSAGSRRRRRRLGWTFGRRTRSWVCGAGSRPVCPNRAPGAAP